MAVSSCGNFPNRFARIEKQIVLSPRKATAKFAARVGIRVFDRMFFQFAEPSQSYPS